MRPSVSVIIPIYNSSRYLAEAIESVLAQRYSPLEILVVDDGSSDHGPALASAYGPPVRVIPIAHQGHPAARNAGVTASTGEFLGFLDADDLWESCKLALQTEAFAATPLLDAVFGHMQNFISPELSAEEQAKIRCNANAIPGLLQGSMLIRREAFHRVGPFPEDRKMGDFLDWYGRATLTRLNMSMLPATLIRRRIHLNNFQRTHKHLRRENLLALKTLLDRRRAAASNPVSEA